MAKLKIVPQPLRVLQKTEIENVVRVIFTNTTYLCRAGLENSGYTNSSKRVQH